MPQEPEDEEELKRSIKVIRKNEKPNEVYTEIEDVPKFPTDCVSSMQRPTEPPPPVPQKKVNFKLSTVRI